IQRQSCDVAAEVVPDAVLLKELLYIGEIEGRDHAVFRFDICSDTTNRFGTGKVTDDGHYKILRVEGFQDTKIFFPRKITAGNAVSISGDHQFSITDAVTEASPATRAIVDIGTESAEVAVYPFDSAEVIFRERKPMLFRKKFLNCLEVFSEDFIAGWRRCESFENLFYSGTRPQALRL